MGKETGISWTDHTFNPWWGCTEVSPGCDLCYARVMAARTGLGWGPDAERRLMSDKYWNAPLSWDRAAAKNGVKRRVFCASMADVLDRKGPESERKRLWELIDKTPNLIWLLLTKRPESFVYLLPTKGFAHDNVMLMCTAENQEYYDKRMPHLDYASRWLWQRNVDSGRLEPSKIPTGVSYEPAIGAITMVDRLKPDWMIFGGETGGKDKRRPVDEAWARSIKAECAEFSVAFFMKQLGGTNPDEAKNLVSIDMRIQEFPEAR